jgi:hypothetical protein
MFGFLSRWVAPPSVVGAVNRCGAIADGVRTRDANSVDDAAVIDGVTLGSGAVVRHLGVVERVAPYMHAKPV